MFKSMTLYKGQQVPDVDIYLFVQRILVTLVMIVFGYFFSKAMRERFEDAPALSQLKIDTLTEELASLREEFSELLNDFEQLREFVDKLKRLDMEELRKELTTFSVEVWQTDIEELQEGMAEMRGTYMRMSDDFAALCGQTGGQSQEMAALKRETMEELEKMKKKLAKQSAAHKDELAQLSSDFKALVWGAHHSLLHHPPSENPLLSACVNISENRKWDHGSSRPSADNGKGFMI